MREWGGSCRDECSFPSILILLQSSLVTPPSKKKTKEKVIPCVNSGSRPRERHRVVEQNLGPIARVSTARAGIGRAEVRQQWRDGTRSVGDLGDVEDGADGRQARRRWCGVQQRWRWRRRRLILMHAAIARGGVAIHDAGGDGPGRGSRQLTVAHLVEDGEDVLVVAQRAETVIDFGGLGWRAGPEVGQELAQLDALRLEQLVATSQSRPSTFALFRFPHAFASEGLAAGAHGSVTECQRDPRPSIWRQWDQDDDDDDDDDKDEPHAITLQGDRRGQRDDHMGMYFEELSGGPAYP